MKKKLKIVIHQFGVILAEKSGKKETPPALTLQCADFSIIQQLYILCGLYVVTELLSQ